MGIQFEIGQQFHQKNNTKRGKTATYNCFVALALPKLKYLKLQNICTCILGLQTQFKPPLKQPLVIEPPF